ncbi:MAG: peptidyl-tRNA hydrolase Pth2 [Candidatus Methanoplasma sp.]|jgi:PTH2 family peptidyl-tRNA hydrolase|nr:peptidyl-tRNA hydrolase Pth2 [Candidatus Methanoplasma sp.]
MSKAGDDECRLAILVRSDLKMGKGKIAAQAGHAAVCCAMACVKKKPDLMKEWIGGGQPKIVLRVESESELYEFKAVADAQGIINSVITDAGRTQIEPGTVTCIGIGPERKSVLDKITGELRML